MALHWNLSGIKDSKDMCWVQDEDGNKDDKNYYLHPVTNSLIWATLIIGMGSITEKNHKEFHLRCLDLQKADGYQPLTEISDGDGELRTFTYEEVKAHIGLKTNVTFIGQAKWRHMVYERVRNNWSTVKQNKNIKDATTKSVEAEVEEILEKKDN